MKVLIIDVREPEEFAESHVKGAINLPPSELMSGAKALQNIPKDTKLILYCRSGARSNASMNILASMGFNNMVNGINEGHVNKLLKRA